MWNSSLPHKKLGYEKFSIGILSLLIRYKGGEDESLLYICMIIIILLLILMLCELLDILNNSYNLEIY